MAGTPAPTADAAAPAPAAPAAPAPSTAAAPAAQSTANPAGGDAPALDAEFVPAPSNPIDGPAIPTAEEQEEEELFDDGDSALGSLNGSTSSISESILNYRELNGRTYHSDRKAGENIYWGPNDEQQNELQDIINHCHMLSLDGKLHMAPLPSDFSGKALDIGTGTGIWAIDFADQYPECHVIGTDLSPIQPAYVPTGCEFQIDDATTEWTWASNTIDYVHFRWMCGVIEDWDRVIREAYRVLKPGGWIEWYDFDAVFISDDDTVDENSALGRWNYLFEGGSRKVGSTAVWKIVSSDIQRRLFTDLGFVNFQHYDTKVPNSPWPRDKKHKEIGMYSQAGWTTDLEGSVTFSATAHGWSREEIAVYCAQARKEWHDRRIHAYYPGRNAWAQKPLDA